MAKGRKADNGSPVTPSSDDIVETVRGLAAVVSESALSELIVEMGDARITLRRGAVGAPVMMPMPQMGAMPMSPMGGMGMPQVHPQSPTAAAPAPAAPAEEKGHVVTSPFVGTFYRRPNPDSPEYVKLNERVDKGQVLCIVEAMKLMNEIEADVAGTIVAVLAEDGSVVEYGQPLFRIAPA